MLLFTLLLLLLLLLLLFLPPPFPFSLPSTFRSPFALSAFNPRINIERRHAVLNENFTISSRNEHRPHTKRFQLRASIPALFTFPFCQGCWKAINSSRRLCPCDGGEAWRVQFELSKSNAMTVSRHRNPWPIPREQFDGLMVEEFSQLKLLGVIFDRCMDFSSHVRLPAIRALQRIDFSARLLLLSTFEEKSWHTKDFYDQK